MKLRLSQRGSISILDVLEDVSIENTSVLRAGITKILGSGRNKIILNLIEAKRVPHDVLREIVKLHLIATELKGSICLVGQADGVKQAVLSFADPPPIKFFTALEAALRSLEEAESKKALPSTASLNAIDELKRKISELETENKSLKGKLQSNSLDEVRKLRAENSALQKQLSIMEQQLHSMIKERKKPFELEALNSRILQLEASLEGFLNQEGLLSAKSK